MKWLLQVLAARRQLCEGRHPVGGSSEASTMYQFFTAKVGDVIDVNVCGKSAAGIVQLDISGEQDTKPKVVSALVQAVRTKGEAKGQLLPFKDGQTAHLILDINFVNRLEPGNVLRFEWETRSGGVMGDLIVIARQK